MINLKLRKSNLIRLVIAIVFTIMIGLFIAAEYQINLLNHQIANLQETVKKDGQSHDESSKLIAWLENILTKNGIQYNPMLYMVGDTNTPVATPTTAIKSSDSVAVPTNLHAGMTETKGITCKPTGNNDGSTNCSEYDYWYSANGGPNSGTLPPGMLQDAK